MKTSPPKCGCRAAPSRQWGLNMIEIMLVTFIISLLSIIALPVYQDYTIRAKVTGGISFVPPVKLRIMEYYLSTNTLPTVYTQLGLTSTDFSQDDTALETLDLVTDPRNGTIELTFDNIVIPQLGAARTITYVPTPKSGTLTWDCTGGTMLTRYRPSQCRDEETASD